MAMVTTMLPLNGSLPYCSVCFSRQCPFPAGSRDLRSSGWGAGGLWGHGEQLGKCNRQLRDQCHETVIHIILSSFSGTQTRIMGSLALPINMSIPTWLTFYSGALHKTKICFYFLWIKICKKIHVNSFSTGKLMGAKLSQFSCYSVSMRACFRYVHLD